MKKTQEGHLFDLQGGEAAADGRIVRVALNTGADSLFDYLLDEALGTVGPGQRVEVPFGRNNKLHEAFVVEAQGEGDDDPKWRRSKAFKLKPVRRVIDPEPLLDEQLLELAKWISQYYVCPLGQVLAAMVPAAVKRDAGVKKERVVFLAEGWESKIDGLRSHQQKALASALEQAGALDAETAMERGALLEAVRCTDGPLKQLARNGVVRVLQRAILRPLPVVPEGLRLETRPVVLNEDQERALAHLSSRLESGEFGITLLHGVTDSGKTEVYIRAIEKTLALGKRAIMLLPEIALTAQTVQRFHMRFENLAVLHSGLTGPQRNAQWQAIRSGKADVVIGARSAIFAPVRNLGLVVVDEEHEPSYKQDTAPRYHGRDVAIKRAQIAGAQCLLGSATPSLETLTNCRSRPSFVRIELPHRVMDLPMPEMRLVNMLTAFEGRGLKHPELISPELETAVKETLERGEQVILLLNRRGYSHFIYCPSCRHSLSCRNCDVTLTFHKKPGRGENADETMLGKHMREGFAVCHYCLSKTLVPRQCPLCGKSMTMIGQGSQRLEEELAKKIPSARVRRIDSDSMAGQDYYAVLRDFAQGEIDILAGTQMLAKGLHFPNVTLVGIISADTALSLPDFRANERTFQLISQVAGRAGRSEKGGRVLIQTFMPGVPVIGFALKGDFAGFVNEELTHRQAWGLPPFGRMAAVLLRDASFERLNAAAKGTYEVLEEIVAREGLPVTLRGPMPATISRIQRHHRMNIIVQAPEAGSIQRLFAVFRTAAPVRPTVQIQIDIDPIGVL